MRGEAINQSGAITFVRGVLFSVPKNIKMEPTLYLDFDSQDGRSGQLSVKGSFAYVGRETGAADLLINSSTISRQHGAVRQIHGRWLYSDLGSTNGSWLNDCALQPNHWVLLHPDDVLQLADWRLRIKLNSFSTFVNLEDPVISILRGDNYYSEQVIDAGSGSFFCNKLDDKLSISNQPIETALFSVSKESSGMQLKLLSESVLELKEKVGDDATGSIVNDTIVQIDSTSVVFLVPGLHEKVEALLTKEQISDPTLAIELETLDLSATATMSKKVFEHVKTKSSSSVQEFQTRRSSDSWTGEQEEESFWGNFEGQLVIALATLLLFLIALIVMTWLLNPV